MSQVKIRQALQTPLVAFAASKNMKVAWENVQFDPASKSYLRAFVFISPTQDPSIGALHKRYTGIFRVQFMASLTDSTYINKGAEVIEAVGEEIVALYPRGLQLTKDGVVVHIEGTPSQASISYDNAYAVVTVEMIYRSDVITT